MNAVNDAPQFAGLNGTPTFTEDGPAVVLDNNATISDIDLDAANDYGGATLTLVRSTGTNADDIFSDDNGTLTFGASDVSLGGIQVGTYTHTNGTLVITFDPGRDERRRRIPSCSFSPTATRATIRPLRSRSTTRSATAIPARRVGRDARPRHRQRRRLDHGNQRCAGARRQRDAGGYGDQRGRRRARRRLRHARLGAGRSDPARGRPRQRHRRRQHGDRHRDHRCGQRQRHVDVQHRRRRQLARRGRGDRRLARVLFADANTRVYFQPNANFFGTSEITFRAWDRSNGSANGASGVDPSPGGGSSAFSAVFEARASPSTA